MAETSWYGSKMRVARVQMPDGRVARVQVPEDATPEQITAFAQNAARQAGPSQSRAAPPQKPTSFWQGVLEEAGKGAANIGNFIEKMPMVGDASRLIGGALGMVTGDPSLSSNARRMMGRELAKSPYRGSTAGKIVGGLLATAPTAMAPGGVLAQGALAGGLLTDDPNGIGLARDAAIGAIANKAGEQVGRRVLAPIAERVGRTNAARTIGETVAGMLPRGMPLPPRAPRISRGERIVSKATPDIAAIRAKVQEAADLKLPFALADADPRLQALGGSVARFSPDAKAIAEQNFNPRALGQADRAVNAIDEYLAPITDIKARSTNIIEGGKPTYGPLYDAAYAAPPITSPRLEQILNTPAGREAVARANTIAANEFRDPKAMGFVLDDAGNTLLEPTIPMSLTTVGREGGAPIQQPGFTTQSLDYVKRGIDDILEPQRNEITGKLNLDEGGSAINGVQRALLDEMDNLNPDYKAARAAYAQYAKQAEALNTGHQVLPRGTLPQRDFEAILARQTPETLPEARRGYATALADQVDRARLSANPYEAIYGSSQQQGKLATIFPEGAPKFDRLYNIEKVMAATRNEALGGSQTQPRNIADQMFQNNALNGAADAGIQVLTGGGVPGATKVLGMAARAIKDRSNLGLLGARQKADELAPALFDTNNQQTILSYLDELIRKQAEQRARDKAYRSAGGLLGVPVAAGALGLSQ